MKSVYYNFLYFNILLIFFFFINNIFLLIIIVIVKGVFYVNLESDIEYEFCFFNNDFERIDSKYLEIDIDDEYIYTIVNQELYLNLNCRFFFDLYGGTETLDNIDFLDFTIYNINDKRNFKHIYSHIFFKHQYNDEYYFYKMNDVMSQMYIDNYYFNLLNLNKDYMFNSFLYKIEERQKIKEVFLKTLILKFNKDEKIK